MAKKVQNYYLKFPYANYNKCLKNFPLTTPIFPELTLSVNRIKTSQYECALRTKKNCNSKSKRDHLQLFQREEVYHTSPIFKFRI